MADSCASCRFWDLAGPFRYIGSTQGDFVGQDCRRYPEPLPTKPGHWCGEHQPRPKRNQHSNKEPAQ